MKVVLISVLFAYLALCEGQVIVDTLYGQVQGQTIPLHTGVNVNSFWAVPYARPPVGELRFAKPEAPEPWDDIFIADTLGSACMQTSRLIWWTHPGWNDFDEDCLHVNIFTPEDMSGSYPVMVWFHGGGYTGSANVQYPGHFLAGKGVVVVVVNYRLGAMGFLSTDADDLKGNWGMYDQQESLRFVRDNIANFGGDPDKVTIFGQSAGASSTGLHLVSPSSNGLFHQAICESGSEMAFWAVNWPAQEPTDYSKQVAEKLNCTTDDDEEMVECLREIDADTLIETRFSCAEGHFCQGFAPVVDGEDGFLPDLPQEFRKSGDYADVPLIQGQCTEDGSAWTAAMIPESIEGGFNRSEFQYYLRNNLLAIWEAQFEEDVVEDAFHATDFYYAPWPHVEDEDLNRDAFTDMITDAAFGYTGDKQVKYQQQTQPNVWHYLLGYRSPNASQFVPEWMGVPHNGELPYVWGYPFLLLNEAVRDDCGIHFDIIDWTEDEDIPYAEFVSTAWANFAKTANPNTPDQLIPPFEQEEQVDWPVYDMEDFNYYLMADEVEALTEYRQRNFAFFREYLGYVLDREMWFTTGASEKTPKPRPGVGIQLSSHDLEHFDNEYITEHWKKMLPDVKDINTLAKHYK